MSSVDPGGQRDEEEIVRQDNTYEPVSPDEESSAMAFAPPAAGSKRPANAIVLSRASAAAAITADPHVVGIPRYAQAEFGTHLTLLPAVGDVDLNKSYAIKLCEEYATGEAVFLGERGFVRKFLLRAANATILRRLVGNPILVLSKFEPSIIKGNVASRIRILDGEWSKMATAPTKRIEFNDASVRSEEMYRVMFPESHRIQVEALLRQFVLASCPTGAKVIAYDANLDQAKIPELMKIACVAPLRRIESSIDAASTVSIKPKVRSMLEALDKAVTAAQGREFTTVVGMTVRVFLTSQHPVEQKTIDDLTALFGDRIWSVIPDKKIRVNAWGPPTASGPAFGPAIEEMEASEISVPKSTPDCVTFMLAVIDGMLAPDGFKKLATSLGGHIIAQRSGRSAIIGVPPAKPLQVGTLVQGPNWHVLVTDAHIDA